MIALPWWVIPNLLIWWVTYKFLRACHAAFAAAEHMEAQYAAFIVSAWWAGMFVAIVTFVLGWVARGWLA